MTCHAILSLALSVGASPFEARLIDAFALQESSRRVHVRGDSGKAWGLFQFHRARWAECGGASKDWGQASAKDQTRAMLAEIRRCRKQIRRRGLRLCSEQTVIFIGRYHNLGHVKRGKALKHNTYTRSLWKHYKANHKVMKKIEKSAGG